MRRLVAISAIALLVGACSGGSAGPTGAAPSGTGTTTPTALNIAGNRPSGAMVRIVNAYAPGKGDPGPIDVYAAPWVESGAKPLVSVPYGTASAFFDPTVSDDQGDMSLSIYWTGETGNGNELVSQTETLKGGELITYVVSTADSVQDNGRRFGSIEAYFGSSSGSTLGQPTPNPGKGLLVVDTVGLDNVLTDADTQTWFLSLGHGCALAIGDDANTLSPIGPGSAATYELDPGTYSGSFHAYSSDSTEIPDCANGPLLDKLKLSIAVGSTSLSLTYAPKDGDLRTLELTLDK